jgi:MFS family permease
MPRTFSLARLLLFITLLCLLCGLAVNFPAFVIAWFLFGLCFAPTIMAWLMLNRFARSPSNVFSLSCVGALVGYAVLAPAIMRAWHYDPFWLGTFFAYYTVFSFSPAISALLVGGIAIWLEQPVRDR